MKQDYETAEIRLIPVRDILTDSSSWVGEGDNVTGQGTP